MLNNLFISVAISVLLIIPCTPLLSQQIMTETPFNSIGNGYFERFGVNWGLNWPGGFARFGMPGQPVPPFGHFDPSAGLQGRSRFANQNFNGFLSFSSVQGDSTTFRSQTPGMVMMNGQSSMFSDRSVSPFVNGYTPVVGNMPPINDQPLGPLDRVKFMDRLLARQNQGENPALNEPDPGAAMLPRRPSPSSDEKPRNSPTISSADLPVPSVAEAKRLFELDRNAEDQEISALFDKAQTAEAEGKPTVAIVYYQMVVRRSKSELKKTAQLRLREIRTEILAKKTEKIEESQPTGKEF